MALIHISGMDCTLKTTICNKLAQTLNCEVVHFDKPQNLEDGKKQYFNFLNSHDFINTNIICDRFHDGEHVYAPIYRNYESNYLHEIEEQLKTIPYLFVNTTTNLDVIINRIKLRGEDFVQEEHYQLILDKFDDFIKKQSMPYIKIDTSNYDITEYINKIILSINVINDLYCYSHKHQLQCNYYGNLFANYFITSDTKNLKQTLIEKTLYEDCWVTNTINKEYCEFQFKQLLAINNNVELSTKSTLLEELK